MKTIIIGCGNLSYSLIPALLDAGHTIAGIYGRTREHISQYANTYSLTPIYQISQMPADADIYIICTADSGIAPTAAALAEKLPHDALVIHTSGSTDISVLKSHFQRCGVLYPLQTFSKGRKVDLAQTPILVEGSGSDTLRLLAQLANSISNNIRPMTSAQRKCLHLSAVFACNFTNHMIAISQVLMNDYGVDHTLLQPLISETFRKAATSDPILSQSGPAVRHDSQILNFHLSMLENYPDLKKIYTFASESIQQFAEKYKNGIQRQA